MEARKFVNVSSKEFGSKILTSLGQLQSEKYFCDVTISCEGRQVDAHKMVLARGSRLFNNILKLNPHHPLIFLSDVKFSFLLNILEYMYRGEVNIDKRELADFLAVARDLDVNNITEEAFNDSNESDDDKSKMRRLDSNPKHQFDVNADYKVKTDTIPDDFHYIVNDFKVGEFEDFETFTNDDFEDIKDENEDKNHSIESSLEKDLNVDYIIKIEMENNSENMEKTIPIRDSVIMQSNSHVHEKNNSHEQKLRIRDITKLSTNKEQEQFTSFENDNSSSFECKQCNKLFTTKQGMKNHVLSIHKGMRYPCSHCEYKATKKDNLRQHILSIHEGMRYPCSHCDYKATTSFCLKSHVLSIHEGRRYPCSQCDYKATQKPKLKTHINKYHKFGKE